MWRGRTTWILSYRWLITSFQIIANDNCSWAASSYLWSFKLLVLQCWNRMLVDCTQMNACKEELAIYARSNIRYNSGITCDGIKICNRNRIKQVNDSAYSLFKELLLSKHHMNEILNTKSSINISFLYFGNAKRSNNTKI